MVRPDLHALDVNAVPTTKLAEGERQGSVCKQPLLADGANIVSANGFGISLVM